MPEVPDKVQRDRALDTGGSFIVQAPAGSGKTELLIQRYLALLSTVEAPEEILAITFTRKAAGEMCDRILAALDEAASRPEPDSAHRALTWRLAGKVLARNRQEDWRLLESPSRLRVMTIDAFNGLLARHMPLRSGSGGAVRISEDPHELYREAARRTLRTAREETEEGEAARCLLLHLDNDYLLAQGMLASLLARRDHWLPRIGLPRQLSELERRQMLEADLGHQIESVLTTARRAVPAEVQDELTLLAAYAAERLEEDARSSPILMCCGMDRLPSTQADDLDKWRGLTALLLTKTGTWRKSVSVACGFPPAGPEEKDRIKSLLETLGENEILRLALVEVQRLPDPVYPDDQLRMLGELLALLPYCAAELALVFRERGEADFVALAQAAGNALGSLDDPGEMALALDYRLRHILVDEFQDTSAGQVAMLRMLTAGWEPGDGRTLFCVGDPMQSIYGFREADVGLYLSARARGIGGIALMPLELTANFRSDRGIVDWVNRTFVKVMPAQEDPRLGAVPFVHARATRGTGEQAPVVVRALVDDEGRGEAVAVLESIDEIRKEDPSATIAVLVRARSHLVRIAPLLKQRGIRFQAVEIERLADTPVIQDLMALTRAVCHLADRTAWLAILRSPLCGATLADLLAVSADAGGTIWRNLSDETAWNGLDEASRRRLRGFRDKLAVTLDERGRRPLHRLVEGAWMALGGPAVAGDETALLDARSYFRLLSSLDRGGDLEDVAALEGHLQDLFAAPDALATPDLQLMTIHKAKGLEFDYVILPGLDRVTRGADKRLLHWLELLREDGGTDLLLAPVEERGADRDPIQAYLSHLEGRRQAFETGRLLYVAMTRARRQVHLVTRLSDAVVAGEREPPGNSLLHHLWPALADQIQAAARPSPIAEERSEDAWTEPHIVRLATDWTLPKPPPSVRWDRQEEVQGLATGNVEFEWAGQAGRAVGKVVHRILERVATEGVDRWPEERVREHREILPTMLAEAGAPSDEIEEASYQAVEAVVNALSDERGRWILSSDHNDCHSEFAVAGVLDGKIVHGVIDRCFVDAEGTRWIIDFKTGRHEGADLEVFMATEVDRYRQQLDTYARLLAAIHPGQPLRVALYYPMHRAWREWAPALASD